MAEVILYHYELSPFSEKMRRIPAFKRIPWHSVETPLLLLKADPTALTGPYRRAPVRQIGADVYRYSALIARRFEQLFLEPSRLPSAVAGAVAILEGRADHRLVHQVTPPVAMELLDTFPPGFFEGRANMTANWSREAFIKAAPHGLDGTRQTLDTLAAHLGSNTFLLGDSFTFANAACFKPVGFLRTTPALSSEIESRPAPAVWIKRIEEFEPAAIPAMSGAGALGIASEIEPEDADGNSVTEANYQLGDDYGTEIFTGNVVRVRNNDITILKDDAELENVAIHYRRADYSITRQGD